MKRVWTISLVMLASLIAGGVAQGTEVSNIGIVDIERVLKDSKYKEAHEQAIKKFYEDIEIEWNERRQRIEAMKRDVFLLSEVPRRRKQEEIAAAEEELEKFRKMARESINQRNLIFLKEFQEKVTAVVEEVAAAKGVGLVLSKAAVIYNKDAQDFTDEVLAKFNALFDKEHSEGTPETNAEATAATEPERASDKDD